MLVEAVMDTTFDCLKMLPFLFVAFILIEALEHYSSDFTAKALAKVGKAGPVVGAVAGCVPQCGFSVMAANLYAGGIISVGTLLSVFIATSDEAILIIMSNPERIREVGILLAAKVIIAVTAGYIIDIFFQNQLATVKESGNLAKTVDATKRMQEYGACMASYNKNIYLPLYIYRNFKSLHRNLRD